MISDIDVELIVFYSNFNKFKKYISSMLSYKANK